MKKNSVMRLNEANYNPFRMPRYREYAKAALMKNKHVNIRPSEPHF